LQVLASKKFLLPQCQGLIERRARMLRILLLEMFEGDSSSLVVKAVDMIEPLCGTFQELRCFQTLAKKGIRQTAE
jgi:hypothetical protein